MLLINSMMMTVFPVPAPQGPDLAALEEGTNQVDHLDAGGKNLR